jgi:pyruvate dehydrogenase complex dehydrogenase (E1) component
MPEFWQFPTVSMGLGPIMAIYQARFLKYLHNRGLADTAGRHVWAFLGDGEMDEPESLGAISLAARERLDNLAGMSDDEIWALNRGGHDPGKIHAAYAAAAAHTGQPTVIVAKTVKGYGMGEAGEGQNITHQQKKMAENTLRVFRDRFGINVPDDQIVRLPYLRPAEGSAEMVYLRQRREALGLR